MQLRNKKHISKDFAARQQMGNILQIPPETEDKTAL